MTRARHVTCWSLLAAIASVAAGCGAHAESPTGAPKHADAKDPNPVISPRVAACPGAEREETHTLSTLGCYEEACDAGDVSGCAGLSVFYLRGKVVASDPKRAVELAQRACDGKHGVGCLLVSAYYLGFTQPNGQTIDATKAVLFAERACDFDLGDGCTIAGGLYLHGEGVRQDDARAKTMLQRGCSLGDDKACEVIRKLETSSATR